MQCPRCDERYMLRSVPPAWQSQCMRCRHTWAPQEQAVQVQLVLCAGCGGLLSASAEPTGRWRSCPECGALHPTSLLAK